MATVTYAAPEYLLLFVAPSSFTVVTLVLDWKLPTGCVLRTASDKMLNVRLEDVRVRLCYVHIDLEPSPRPVDKTDIQASDIVPPTSDVQVGGRL